MFKLFFISIILIFGFHSSINGKEEDEEILDTKLHPTQIYATEELLPYINKKWLPNSFFGLKRFDSPTAYIYSQEGDDLVYAKNKIDNVANDFEIITGEKPKKGILIVIDPLKKHPWFYFYDLFHSWDVEGVERSIPLQFNIKYVTSSIEESLLLMAKVTRFDFFKLLVSFDQQDREWSGVDVDNILEKKDTNKDILEPWVLFLPSEKCLLHSSKKLLLKIIRAKEGFSEYHFAKLDMGKLRARTIDHFSRESNTALFNCFLSTQDPAKEEKNIFENSFNRQLKIEENGASHKL